jgi:hypothetical protein
MAVVDGFRVQPLRVAVAMRDGFRRAGLEATARIARVAGRARVVEES